jgi:hypothetical protein
MTNGLWLYFLVRKGDDLRALKWKAARPGLYELLLSRNQLAHTLVTAASARMRYGGRLFLKSWAHLWYYALLKSVIRLLAI